MLSSRARRVRLARIARARAIRPSSSPARVATRRRGRPWGCAALYPSVANRSRVAGTRPQRRRAAVRQQRRWTTPRMKKYGESHADLPQARPTSPASRHGLFRGAVRRRHRRQHVVGAGRRLRKSIPREPRAGAGRHWRRRWPRPRDVQHTQTTPRPTLRPDGQRKEGVEIAKKGLAGAPCSGQVERMNLSPRSVTAPPNAITREPGDGYPRNLAWCRAQGGDRLYKEMADFGGKSDPGRSKTTGGWRPTRRTSGSSSTR